MRRLPRPAPRPRSRLQEHVQAFGDLISDARSELDRRECSVLLEIVASRVAREIAGRLDLERRP